jgi:prepilin-type N-terminal cleavage/methylation domain-containing protein
MCSRDESGFTLIELLVVVLIISILVALAVTTLLGQKNKAYDASAKSLAGTAQTTAETIATDYGGSYKEVSKEKIHEYEPSVPLSEAAAKGGPWLSEATETEKGQGYKIVVTAPLTKDTFEIAKNEHGEVEHNCDEVVKEDKACPSKTW